MTRFVVIGSIDGPLLVDMSLRTGSVVARFVLPSDEAHKPQAVADALNTADLSAYDDMEPF